MPSEPQLDHHQQAFLVWLPNGIINEEKRTPVNTKERESTVIGLPLPASNLESLSNSEGLEVSEEGYNCLLTFLSEKPSKSSYELEDDASGSSPSLFSSYKRN